MKKLFSKFGKKKSSRDPSPANSSIRGSRGSINLIGVNVGYEINEKDLGKLHKAIWKNEISKVRTLVKREVGSLDKEKRTPLHLASAFGNISMVEILLEYNAKVNVADNDQKTPLIKAIEGGHVECVELLLSYRAEVEICDSFGDKPVHHAAKKNDARIFKLLIENGAKIDEKNQEGMAPIHIAVDNKDADFMTFLLVNGADIDTFDGECRTALMLAGKLDLQDMVRLLLENEADASLVDNKGWSAEDHAMMAGHSDCVRMIKRAQSHRGSSSQRSRASSHHKRVNGHGDESDTEVLDSSNGRNGLMRSGNAGTSGARVLGIDASIKVNSNGRRASKSTDSDNSWVSDDESLPSGRKEKDKPRLNLQKMLNVSETARASSPERGKAISGSVDSINHEERIEIILNNDNNFEEVSIGDEGRSRVTKIPKIRDTRQRSRSSEKREPMPPTSARSEISELGLDDSWQSESESSSLPFLPKVKDIANGGGVSFKPMDPVKESSIQGSPQVSKPDKSSEGEVLIMAATRRGESDDDDSEWDSTVQDPAPTVRLQTSGGKVKPISPRTGFSFLDPDDDEEESEEDEEIQKQEKKVELAEKKLENTFGTGVSLGANAAWDNVPETPRPQLSARESDWDSTIPETTPRDGNVLRDFDWDSSSHPEVTPRTIQRKDSDWDDSSIASDVNKPTTAAIKKQCTLEEQNKTVLNYRLRAAGIEVTLSEDDDVFKSHSSSIGAKTYEIPCDETNEDDSTLTSKSHMCSNRTYNVTEEFATHTEVGNTKKSNILQLQSFGSEVKPAIAIPDLVEEFNEEMDSDSLEKAGVIDRIPEYAENDKTVDSDWDSDSLSASIKSPRDFHQQLQDTTKSTPIMEMDFNESDNDNQLSAIEEESLGRPTSESEKEHTPKAGVKKAVPTDKSNHSDWDSSTSEASPRVTVLTEKVVSAKQPGYGATCPLTAAGDIGSSNEEEEEESEWEIERRTAKAMAEEEKKFAASIDGLQKLEQERYADRIENETENKLAEEARFQFAVQDKLQDLNADGDRTPTASPIHETILKPISGGQLHVSVSPLEKEEKQSLEVTEIASATGFNASHQKGKKDFRESQSGYDSDSTINETDPGRSVNITNDPSLTSPTGAYIHGVLGGPDHPDLVEARRVAEEEEDGLSYTSTEAEPVMSNVANELSEIRRQLDRERELRAEAESRTRLVEADKKELEARSVELERERSKLEATKAELESRTQSAKFLLAEEEERRQNTEKLLEKTRQQLKAKEDLYFEEQKEKQRAELDLRNLELELSGINDNVNKLETERAGLERALQQERQLRQANEELNKEQMRVQQAMQDRMESEIPLTSRSLEGSPLRRFKKTESMENLATELMTTKTELDRVRQRFKDERTKWVTDNDDLQERIDGLSKDIKLNQEALEQASMQYTLQLNSLRSENNGLCSNMEKVKTDKRNLEEELNSMKHQLEAMSSGVERTQIEQVDEWTQRLQIRERELQQLRETNRNLQDKMTNAETRISSVERELKASNSTLGERNTQLKAMRHELEQRRRECEELNEALKHEEEMNERLRSRLSELEENNTNMHQNLKSLLNSFNNRDDFAPGVYDRLYDIVGLLESNKAKTDVELENSNLKMEVDGLRTRLSNSLLSSTERAPDGASSAASVADAHLSALIDRIEKAEATNQHKLSSGRQKQRHALQPAEEMIEPTHITSASALRREHEAELALHRERANDLEQRLKLAESDEESSRTDQSLLNERHNATGESAKSANLNRRLLQLEKDNHQIQRKLEQERMDASLKNEKLMQLAKKLRSQEDKNNLLEEELDVIKDKLRSAKERFKKFDGKKSSLSQSMDQDEAINDIRQQLELLRSRIPEEKNKERAEDITRDMTVIRSLEKAVSKLERQKKKLEDDFYLYQMYVQTNYVDKSTMDSWQSQLQSQAQSEVNAKLVEVNRYLDETTRQRERIDVMRNESEDRMRNEVDKIKREKNEEVDKLQTTNTELNDEKEKLRNELRQMKDFYDQERRVREKLAEQLDKANDNAAAAQAQLSVEREHTRSMSAANLLLTNSIPLGYNNYQSPSMMSLYSQPANMPTRQSHSPSPYHSNGLRATPTRFGGSQVDLQNRLRSELDRSISKHMEAGKPPVCMYQHQQRDPTDTTYEVVKPVELINSSPLDTILNGSNDDLPYLTYLKRKYLI